MFTFLIISVLNNIERKIMKNYNILILVTFILIASCKVTPKIALDESGTFYKMLGGALDEKAHDVVETPDGGFMVAGSTKILVIDEASGSEVEKEVTYVSRTDKYGNVIWKKQYAGQAAKAILQAPDGNWFVGLDSLVVVSSTVSHTDYALMKIDNNGNPLWVQKYSNSVEPNRTEVVKKIQMIEGEIYIVGNAVRKLPDETELNSVVIIATNLDGVEVKRQEYGSLTIPTANTPADKRPTSANNAIIDPISNLKFLVTIGSTLKQGDDKINSSLIIFRRETIVSIDAPEFGGGGDDVGESIQLTRDNGYVICGTTNSSGNGGKDMFVIKLAFQREADGRPYPINNTTISWNKTFGGGGDDEGKSIYPTSDGGYLLLGNVATTTAGTDIHLIKLDAFGNQVWEKFFGGTRNDQAKFVKELSNGDILILGTISFENNDMITLIRANKNGELVK
jgi:hypothetical protein